MRTSRTDVPKVAVSHVDMSYEEAPILQDVSLTLGEKEIVCILGPSGCGKSTFLRLLLAQERPTRGEIRVAGARPAEEPGLDRGVVFQRYSVFPHMTVRANLIAAEEFAAGGRLPRPLSADAEPDAGAARRRHLLYHRHRLLCPRPPVSGVSRRLARLRAGRDSRLLQRASCRTRAPQRHDDRRHLAGLRPHK